MSDIMRVAIIGLGHIGRVHIAALTELANFELVAACDKQADLQKYLPEGTSFYSNHSELLASDQHVDAVIVATPNRTHFSIAIDVISAGYDVILEKPAANSMSELEQLQALADAKQCRIYYAFHAALAAEVRWLVEHLRKSTERYGPVTGSLSRFYDPYIDPMGKRLPHADGLDDCWSDSAVNALSVVDLFLPVDTLKLRAFRKSRLEASEESPSSVSAQFNFAVSGRGNAGLSVIETAWDQGINYKCTELYFAHTGWRIIADHSAQSVTAQGPDGEEVEWIRFDGERLKNHYLGVFSDARLSLQAAQLNSTAAFRIHSKVFEVSQQLNNKTH